MFHSDRNVDDEIERQNAIEKELDFEFTIINPDESSFNVFKVINKIYRRVKKSLTDIISEKWSKLNSNRSSNKIK